VIILIPDIKLARVFWRAKPRETPPIPKAVSIGVIEMPIELKISKKPQLKIRTLARNSNREVREEMPSSPVV
jgi:hypothetical protein